MTTELWSAIFGWGATICMIFGYMPQALHTMRTRKTDDLSLTAWCFMGLGSIFFVVNGLLLQNWPLAATNMITGCCSIIIICMKLYNDSKKRKQK
ncbi:MAG: hypothetical protein K2O37_07275 [Bacteroidales bacterium]|nr:hypothetical protein [Bacteroidales bacterium]MDE7102583.1 hypothetical protein [Bacteroidales bacterium]